jgi:hypothetical protein
MNQLSGRYLEDFKVGQTFSSGRLRIDGERPSHLLPSSIRNPSTSMRRRRAARAARTYG